MCVQAPAGHLLRLLGAHRIMLAAQLVSFSCLAALSLASEHTFLFVLCSLCIGAAQVNATLQCGCADLQEEGDSDSGNRSEGGNSSDDEGGGKRQGRLTIAQANLSGGLCQDGSENIGNYDIDSS